MEKIEMFKFSNVNEVLDEKILKNILKDFKNEIKLQRDTLKKANKIDLEVTNKTVKLEVFENIIDLYAKLPFIPKQFQKKVVAYRGDPYLTINILLQALINQKQVLIINKEYMLGVNEVLIAIYSEILKKYKLENLVFYVDNYNMQLLKEIKKLECEKIVIGDTNIYQLIEDNKKFYPYNNIIFYSVEKELEELKKTIYEYANENQVEFEILYENDLDEAIEYINDEDFANIVVLLTKKEEIKHAFEERIEDKILYINENPFKAEVGKIYNYFA